MECAASVEDPDMYPGPLEFPACDISSGACSAAAACLVCLAPVDELANHNKLLRHSGVRLVTRLQQLLPLSPAEDLTPVCPTCVSLVVSIDELELQLSEQHCQLQRRHVHKVEQQDWQQAAEQVICSAGQEEMSAAEQRPAEQEAALMPEVPGADEETGKHAEVKPEMPPVAAERGERGVQLQPEECCTEGAGHLDGQHDEQQDKLMCQAQGEGMKHTEGSVEQHGEVRAATAVENVLSSNTETGRRPVRSTRNVKPKKYCSQPQDDFNDPDDPPAPAATTATTAPLASVATDSGSAAHRQAELQRRSLASLSVDRGHDRPYQCLICERRLRDRTTALRHVMSHLAERPYLCPHCPRGFVRRSYLQAHLCQHTGERPFSCHCGHAAVSAAALAAHRKAHYAAKTVRCSQCDKRFRKRSDLIVHQRTHTGERPFRCGTCQRAFASASSLNAHAKKHSGTGLRCDRCSKAFEDEARLRAHRLAHDTKPFCCDQCGMQFTRATTLRRHQTRHGASPVHRCPVCRRTFRLATALRDHARVHNGERPFECDECGRKFALQSTLKTHQRRHTGEKPFKCKLCPRAFAQATPLKRHLKTHRADAPDQLAAAGGQGGTLPPPLPPPPPAQAPTTSLVTVMEAFTPLPGNRSGGASMGEGCGDGTVMGGSHSPLLGGGDAGLGGGGEVYHELQPLSPRNVLRCPLCSVETIAKEDLDQHMKRHLAGLGEPAKAPQSDLPVEW